MLRILHYEPGFDEAGRETDARGRRTQPTAASSSRTQTALRAVCDALREVLPRLADMSSCDRGVSLTTWRSDRRSASASRTGRDRRGNHYFSPARRSAQGATNMGSSVEVGALPVESGGSAGPRHAALVKGIWPPGMTVSTTHVSACVSPC
jgi:hypothetical protein